MNRQPSIAESSPRHAGRLILAALLVAALAGACQRQPVAASSAGETIPPATAPSSGEQTTPAPATTTPGPATTGDLLVLGAGQSAEIAPATTLRFDRIVSDSRCPADVQCVWAGEVRIALTLSSPEDSTGFELAEATANSTTVQSFRIEMAEFGPCQSAASKAAPAAECASLRVTQAPGP